MGYDLLEGLLGDSFEIGKVTAKIILGAAELLYLVPNFIVTVTTYSLHDIRIVREVTIVNGSMVP